MRAQTTGTVKGVVRDAQTLKPLAAATVALRLVLDTNEVGLADAYGGTTGFNIGDVTGNDGVFTISKVVIGRSYTLLLKYVGYKVDTSRVVRIEAGATQLDLETVVMHPDAVDASDVVVEEKRPDVVVMADKTVYAIEQSGTYTANTVSELLGQLPSVFVDPDGNISLRGDNSVQIMMNGRVLNMTTEQRNKFLQSLPASIVKDVEIRATPGVQFDASASGGIINIISRRTMSDMFGGVVNGGANTRNSYDAGLNLYYNDEGFNASLGGNVSIGRNDGYGSSSRTNFLDSLVRRDAGSNTNASTNDSYNAYGQVDYELDPMNIISGSFNRGRWGYTWSSAGQRTFYDPKDNVISTFRDRTIPGATGGSVGENTSASMLFKHLFTDEHKISLDVSYDNNQHESSDEYFGEYTLPSGVIDSMRSIHRISLSREPGHDVNVRLDYVNPLNDSLSLSVGAKSELEWSENFSDVTNLDPITRQQVTDTTLTYHYLPKTTTHAVYGNLSYRPWKPLSFQLGIRIEQANVAATHVDGSSVIDKTYLNVFPGASASYTISEESSVTLSYRRSVRLPSVDMLNPIRSRWGQFWESVGNPDLQPEIYNSFNINYSYMWGRGNMWSISPSYTSTTNSLERSETLKDGLTTSTTANFVGEHRFGASVSFRLQPLEWLSFDASTDIFSSINRGGTVSGDIYSSGTGYSANGSTRISLTEGLSFNMSAYIWQPAIMGAVQNSNNIYVTASLRQSLFDKALVVTLRVNDPFNQQVWQHAFTSPQFRTESFSQWSSRFATLNVTYTFGKTPRMEDHDMPRGGGGSEGGGGGMP